MERTNILEQQEEEEVMLFSQEDDTEDDLNHHFKHPLQDSDSFKQPNHQCFHQCSTNLPSCSLISTTPQQDQFYNPQQEGIIRRNMVTDMAVLEILRERREAIESGRLKKKRLLEAFEDAIDQMGFQAEVQEAISSGDHQLILRCSCCYSSSATASDAAEDGECVDGNYSYSSDHTSSTSNSLPVEGNNKKTGDDKGQRWMAKIAAAWVVAVLVAVALGIINLATFDQLDESLMPT